MNLFLYQGNNYYNRKIIHANSNSEYINRGFRLIASVNSVAFIVNDGITTSQVINYDHNELGFGDYVIVYDDYNTIVSRWWVVKNTVVRNGQVMMQLLRDVISDWYDEILTAPSYIRKGGLNSPNDPAIYNNENMSFNQIKTWEKPIKDKTGIGWYVGYISKDLEAKTITVPDVLPSATDVYETVDEYPFYKYRGDNAFKGEFTSITHVLTGHSSFYDYRFGWDNDGNPKTPSGDKGGLFNWKIQEEGLIRQLALTGFSPSSGVSISDSLYKVNATEVCLKASQINNWEQMAISMGLASTQIQTEEINAENGRTIKVGDKYYNVVINSTMNSAEYIPDNSSVYTSKMLEILNGIDWINTAPSLIQHNVAVIQYTQNLYTVSLEEAQTTTFKVNIPGTRRHTEGVPYDIFAIPATKSGLPERIMSAIINALPKGNATLLYDAQYLPYCPIGDEFIDTGGRIRYEDLQENTDYVLPQTSTNEYSLILFASRAEFKKQVNSPAINIPNTARDYKLSNECDIYRVCSPNYDGQFEFSASKNGGVTSWNISMTFKPYTPYIRIAPNFAKLYGANFDDARGLVCGGDFSITQTNDAWEQYELQNKNFQKIFDRQIKNMEINNSMQRANEIVGGITGTVGGAVSGIAGGAMAGSSLGPYGAIIGGVVGGVASAAGGIGDIAINETLRKESISYARDQFGYSLQNIKALPYSLTKVGTQNTDYKIWPFVEYYTCSDTEKQALMDKLEWNGYSIERIGTIDAFLYPDKETFIQGKLIRLDGIEAGSNITNVINTELQTGVYFT